MEYFYLENGFTKQSMKDLIKKYNNGTRSMDAGACVYETEDLKNRCAVGCFIPDGHEALKYSGSGGALICEFPDLVNKMPLDGTGLQEFQDAHDNYEGENLHRMLFNWIDERIRD